MAELKTQVCVASSVIDVDFEQWKQRGIECVLFDIEGTLTAWGAQALSDDVVGHIKHARLPKIGIITNINRSHLARVQAIAAQLGARDWQLPLSKKDRKPSPNMILKSLEQLKATPEKTIMIGDKLLDVVAARRAGVQAVIWVNKYGEGDHWFDALVYRRVEQLLKRRVSRS